MLYMYMTIGGLKSIIMNMLIKGNLVCLFWSDNGVSHNVSIFSTYYLLSFVF